MIVQFVDDNVGFGGLGSDLAKAVDTAFAKQDLRGLRVAVRDLSEMVRGLSVQRQAELNGLLESSLGIDVDAERERELGEVIGISHRGAIRNEREYRLVAAWLDSDDGELPETTRTVLEALLSAYGGK